MNNRGNFNLGDEIRFIVQDAVNNKDFNRLNSDIRNVVNGALDEVRRSIGGNRGNHQTWKVNDYSQSYDQDSQTWDFNNNQQGYKNNSQEWNAQDSNKQNRKVPKADKNTVPVGKVLGSLLTVFGSIASIGFLIAIIVLSIIGYSLGINIMYKIIAFILLPCFIASMVLLLNGGRIRKRLKRFTRYITQMHDRNYCMIKDFSSITGRSI